MPLKRLTEDHRVVTWRGVEFWMIDQAGALVFCRVRQDALRAHASRNHIRGSDDIIFEACQDELHKAASDIFDAIGVNEAGCIIVTSDVMAPTRRHVFTPKPKGPLKEQQKNSRIGSAPFNADHPSVKRKGKVYDSSHSWYRQGR